MRRAGPKRRKIKYRWKLAGLLLAVAALFAAVDSQLRPVVETMAQYQCRVVSVIAINEAVMDELEKMGDTPQRLVRLEKNADGTVSNVELDSVEMNRMKARLTEAVSNRLMSLENQDVSIPLGTLLGWQLLAGRRRFTCKLCRPALWKAMWWTRWKQQASTRRSTGCASALP